MNEPKLQGQHRLSQVYLKQFGYQKDGKWWVSIYQRSKEFTDNILIEKFTKETNIFDLPYKDIQIKRHFEKSSNLVENHYRTVISNLHNQKQLTQKDRDVLCNFVPNLMCRTKPFRHFITLLLNDSITRDKFLNEITMFGGNAEETKELLKEFNVEHHLNLAIGILMNHLVTVLRHFRQVIIKDSDNKGWITTDNPVFLDKQGHNEWVMPIQSEIYFPLSKVFCLFMYHHNSDLTSNPLRQLKSNKVNSIDFNTFNSITKKILTNLDEYEFLIMPCQMDKTDVTK
jgi:hypothetical protein